MSILHPYFIIIYKQTAILQCLFCVCVIWVHVILEAKKDMGAGKQ